MAFSAPELTAFKEYLKSINSPVDLSNEAAVSALLRSDPKFVSILKFFSPTPTSGPKTPENGERADNFKNVEKGRRLLRDLPKFTPEKRGWA